ncbi:MAG: flagellar hook assembly protein FlgD [Gammaproteobacteria bacterium]|nr:flagellar hook assembly protein FlgD [Gammaproteobacteria bacterium]MDH4313240.1 flagellar hook assembly protein FlgD [Gammaproteobacteria bacterium]MDH5213554.1 flagellar hook assembly protein FlgD [Gammaproteobacteria bacterium]
MTTISGFEDAALFAPPPQRASRSDLGQEDFLKLMITQFRNQDPFEPMDNGQFLGQLAQFSTVSGIESLNGAFSGLSASMANEQALQAANLVGHNVLALTDVGYLADGGSIAGGVELGSAAGNVQIDITNRNGELVQRLNLGEQQAGLVRFNWDGRDSSGEQADSDHYMITARVVRGANTESLATLLESRIESVTLGQFGQGMTLNLPGGDTLPLSLVRRII